MQFLGKYWKALLAVVLLVAVVMVYSNYDEERKAHRNEVNQLTTNNQVLLNKVEDNMKYEGVQDKLDAASAQIAASRLELYQKFPVEMKEEDQIMYVLYLEKIFGTEIMFQFNQQPTPVFLPGKTHAWWNLVGYSPRGRKESDTTERLHFSVRNKVTNQR